MNNNKLYNTIAVFLISIIILFTIKPGFLYDEKNKNFKKFGLKKSETIITPLHISLLFSIFVYLL